MFTATYMILYILSRLHEAGWLAGIAFIAPAGLWVISHMFYLPAFLTTRKTGSKAVGFLGILAGTLHIVVLVAFLMRLEILRMNVELLILLMLPVLFAIIYLGAGARWLVKRPTNYYQY